MLNKSKIKSLLLNISEGNYQSKINSEEDLNNLIEQISNDMELTHDETKALLGYLLKQNIIDLNKTKGIQLFNDPINLLTVQRIINKAALFLNQGVKDLCFVAPHKQKLANKL